MTIPARVRETHRHSTPSGASDAPCDRVRASSRCAVSTVLAILCFAATGLAAEPAPPAQPAAARDDGWQKLFDGKELGRWKVIDEYTFKKHGNVSVADGAIVMQKGTPATGIKWTGPFPKDNYEISLEGKRVEGDDFFASLTFPVGDKALTLVVGGWGGQVVGLSIVDGEMAIDNQTCQYKDFKANRWYRVRLRVTAANIEAWVDDEKLVDLGREDHQLTLYWDMEPMQPFGIATWYTTGAVRDIRLRKLNVESESRKTDD